MMDHLRSTLLLLSMSTVLGGTCAPRMEGGDTVDLLNRLMRTENPRQGLLLHVPDYIESGSGYLPMTHYNQHFKASNPTFPLTYAYEYDYPDLTDSISKAFPGFVSMNAPVCPTVTECSNGGGTTYDCEGFGPEIWGFAYVTEVYGTKYAANSGLPDYIESKAKGNVCYPTDANAIDQRDPSGNGACKDGNDQDLVCNANGVCLNKRSNKCKCEYGDIPNEGDGVGQWIVDNGEGTCGKISDGNLQAAFYVDAAACWTDVNDDSGMRNMVKHSNSLWDHRSEWLNDVLPEKQGKYGELSYWGWTECTVNVEDYNTKPEEHYDALAIILPTQEHKAGWEGDNWGGGSWGHATGSSLCDLALEAQIRLESTLHAFWTQGRSKNKPIVIMEQTRGIDSSDCDKFWSGSDCEDGYKKHFFRQSFIFPAGSCLLLNPDGEVYYYRDDPLNNEFPCKDRWPNGYDFSSSGGHGGWWKAAKAHKTGKKPKSTKKSSNWHASSGWEEEEKHSWHSADDGENNWNHDDSSWHEDPSSWDEEWKSKLTKSSKKSWNHDEPSWDHWQASENSWDDSKSSKHTEWGRSGDWQDWSSGSWVNEKYQWKEGHR